MALEAFHKYLLCGISSLILRDFLVLNLKKTEEENFIIQYFNLAET